MVGLVLIIYLQVGMIPNVASRATVDGSILGAGEPPRKLTDTEVDPNEKS